MLAAPRRPEESCLRLPGISQGSQRSKPKELPKRVFFDLIRRCNNILGARWILRFIRGGSLRQNVHLFGLSSLILAANSGQAQWTPPSQLQRVPVREDCAKTNGAIGIAFQPTLFSPNGAIFLCPTRALEIDQTHPGASFFFRVHEYGHLALHTRNEALADGWAAQELSQSVAGRTTLRAALRYFTDLGNRFALMYGSGYDRALTVAESGGIPHQDWPAVLIEYRRNLSEKRARNGSIRLSIVDQTADGLLWIDDQLVGFVSTLEGYLNPPVPTLASQTHRLCLRDVWITEIGPPNRLIAKELETSVEFEGSNSPSGLIVTLRYQGDSLIVSVSK
jgi:hypothetical protein